MRFSRKSLPVPPKLVRRVPYAWDQPETEFPGTAPIDSLQLDRSEQAAIAITGLSAYTTGFEIFVTRLIRPDVPGLDADPPPGAPRAVGVRRSFQLSLQLADGSTVVGERSRGDAEPTGPILASRGGGGTSHHQLMRWWAWPLPPAGPLEFICQWPEFGIGETRVGIDAQLILDASQRSIRVWPQGED